MNATDQSTEITSAPRELWADLIALERPAQARVAVRRNGRSNGRRWQQGLLLVAPVAVAWGVISLLPARYVSDTNFILRHQASAALPASSDDFSGTPTETGSADSYAVRDFLLSRDAMIASGGNFAGNGEEARYRDFAARVTVDYETSSGVITIHAQAATAAQARDLALGLRNAAGGLVARFDQASAASEYLAPLAEPDLPDAPIRQDQPLALLSALALGLALAWGRRA